jgi:lysophospholipase L1-like esterase
MTRTRPALATLFAGLLLAACGGGTQQQEVFVPQRYFALGDDASAFTPNGRKYSINGLNTNNAIDCQQQPLWIQQVASLWNFVFAECNPQNLDVRAKTLAFAGAKVADVAAQIEAQVAAGGFRDKDIVTVYVGVNDVLELYREFPARAEASLMSEARQRGQRIGQIVNRLVDLGAKVIVSTVPDVSLTPYGQRQRAEFRDTDRAALMTRLTAAMNEQLGVSVLLDGRFVGIVQADLRFAAIGISPGSFGFINITEGVCTVPLPNCTTSTVPSGVDPGGYLWADDTRLSPAGQTQLAALAADRARRNPF